MSPANLVAAQKLDPKITRIIYSVSSAAIYGFIGTSWAKTEYEGALLVCERNDPNADCCFIVLNQQKPQNFIALIEADTSLQRKNEYLLYKPLKEVEVKAIWFYTEPDCIRTFGILKKASDQMKARQDQLSQPPSTVTESENTCTEIVVSGNAQNRSKDIIKMLSKAQESFGHQAPGNPSGDIPRHQSSASEQHRGQPIANILSKMHAMIRDDASPSSSSQRGNSGAPFVSLAGGNVNVGDGDRSKMLSQGDVSIDSGANAESSMRGVGGTLGGIVLGKGRGRGVSDVNPVVRQLFGPSNTSPTSHQPVASAFTHVGSRPKVTGSGDSEIITDATVAAIPLPAAPMLPSVSPSMSSRPPVMGGIDELLAPSDLDSFNGGEQGDRFYQSAMPSRLISIESTLHSEPTTSGPGPSVRVGQSVLNIEQFKQCYIYLLEHDRFFLETVFDLFVKHSTAGSSASNTTWRG